MSPDEFASKYQVHKRIAEGPVRSYFGRSRSAKVVALVHYLDGGDTPENAARLAQVRVLAGSRKHLVLDVCDVEGTPVVVTRFILNFTTFDAWLATESAAPSPQPAAPAAGGTAANSTAPAVSGEQQPETAATSQPPAAKPPGEFTRMFGQPSPPPAQPSAGALYDISTAPTVRTERVAPPPSAGPPAKAPDATPAAPPPGEFTKLFHPPASAPEPPAATPPTPSPAAPPQSGGAPEKAPGEFTSLFSAGGDAPPPASAPTQGAGAGEFTSLTRGGADKPPPAAPTPGPPPAAPAPPTPPAPRRGEFTALFGKRAMPEGVTPAEPPPPAPPAPPATPSEGFSLAEPQDAGDDLYRRLHSTPQPPSTPPPPQQVMPPSGVPSPQPPTPAAPPGDFTRVFGAPPPVPPASVGPPAVGPGFPPSPHPWPPEAGAEPFSQQPASDYLARLQGAPPAPPPAAPPVPPPVQTTAPGRGIASEFTRALRRISASVLPPPEPETPAAQAPAGPRRSALPWVIAILAVVAVVAVGIVLYFILAA